jgi:hypothetical protein
MEPARLFDRRTHRSSESPLALRYQLESTLTRGNLEAVVLANDEGLPLASAGENVVCAELAAVAPFLGRGHFGMPLPPMLRGAEVAVRPLLVHGMPLYLATVGGSVARDALLLTSLRGVERILTRN